MFKSYLKVKQVNALEWELLEPLVYDAGRFGVITAPAGFVCDFCSVPRVPLAFWICGDLGHGAGIIHDYIYRVGDVPRGRGSGVLHGLAGSRRSPVEGGPDV